MGGAIPFIGPALSLAGSLFGGSNKSSQQVTPASTTQNAIPSWLLPLYQASAGFLLNNLGKSFGYPGQMQVGMSPLSQQAYSDIGSLTGITPFAGGELTADITGAYTDPTQNPITQNMIRSLIEQNRFDTGDALRSLHGNFSMISPAAGMEGSSGASDAQAQLLARLATGLGSNISQLLQNVYGQERGIQSNATSAALGIPGAMQNIGQYPTQLQTQNIGTLMSDWQNQIKNMMGVPAAVFPSVANAFAPSYYTPQYGSNPFSAAASGFRSLVNSPNNQTVAPGQYTDPNYPSGIAPSATDASTQYQTPPVYPDSVQPPQSGPY